MSTIIQRDHVVSLVPERPRDAHKGIFGHLFVLAGSPGFTGAAYLASEGGLRSGVGLVTVGIPESLNWIMEVKTTEAMTLPLPETGNRTFSRVAVKPALEFAQKCSAVALGPGISRNKGTDSFVHDLLRQLKVPVVVDADGLNALAANINVIKARQAPTVLTPHPGEMSHLIGKSTAEIQQDRRECAVEFAREWNVILVLKGHGTVVASPSGEALTNPTGCSGMASGGAGDVLTGLIGGLLAQGLSARDAAVIGVYLHGLAGDIASETSTEWGMVASDIVRALPAAWKRIAEDRDGTG
jgi:hydroxyethylthiazole kinase-like uncharacterized protein yjeF